MDKPIRVLHVFGTLEKGGAESRTMDIYREINKERVQFDFMVHTDKQGFFEPEVERLGGRVYREVPRFKGYNFFKYMSAWNKFLSSHKYDCVHINTVSSSPAILIGSKRAGIEFIVCHSRSASDVGLLRKLATLMSRQWTKRFASERLAVSEIAGRFAFGSGYTVIKDAIKSEMFRYDADRRGQIRRALGVEDKFVVGHVGRFHEVKNHMFLIDAFTGISDKITRSHLILAGDGEERTRIEKKIDVLGLSGRVTLLGMRDDIADLLQAFDVLLLPSVFEGFPGAVIEAQAAGIPCILSDTITPEVNIIKGLVMYLPIDKGIKLWVEEVVRLENNLIPRRDTCNELKAAGIDIADAVIWYERFYTRNMEKG